MHESVDRKIRKLIDINSKPLSPNDLPDPKSFDEIDIDIRIDSINAELEHLNHMGRPLKIEMALPLKGTIEEAVLDQFESVGWTVITSEKGYWVFRK
jgi:hypothetical protein